MPRTPMYVIVTDAFGATYGPYPTFDAAVADADASPDMPAYHIHLVSTPIGEARIAREAKIAR